MRFLLYVPGTSHDGSPHDILSSVGLGEIAQGVDTRVVDDGPIGTGLLFGWLSSTQNQFDFFPDRQTWSPASTQWGGELGRYWVGIWNDDPPTETDLRRPDHRAGVQIELGNNESWSIPTPNTLERYPRFDDDGKLFWACDEQFNWLTTDLEKRKASGLITREENGKTITSFVYDDESDFEFMCRLLQINYRVTPEVVAQMNLLSETAIRNIIAGLFGMTLED